MYRESMAANRGMLYVFPFERTWKIWMLNMRFALDVIWLDRRGVVVHVERNLRPCRSFFSCKTYAPGKGAKYVLELNSGSARRLGIGLGEVLPSVRVR
ncbi:MAG: DUF192 domain-containing protein [Candidatus Micrarchaeota archaeon]|nr:DUF192 domain-containing protein [Candidatus Micrarchaeota archaeon]